MGAALCVLHHFFPAAAGEPALMRWQMLASCPGSCMDSRCMHTVHRITCVPQAPAWPWASFAHASLPAHPSACNLPCSPCRTPGPTLRAPTAGCSSRPSSHASATHWHGSTRPASALSASAGRFPLPIRYLKGRWPQTCPPHTSSCSSWGWHLLYCEY